MATPTTNPFNASAYYVAPTWAAHVDAIAGAADASVLASLRGVPIAFWVDRKSKVHGNTTETLEGLLRDASAQATPPLCVVVLCAPPSRVSHSAAPLAQSPKGLVVLTLTL